MFARCIDGNSPGPATPARAVPRMVSASGFLNSAEQDGGGPVSGNAVRSGAMLRGNQSIGMESLFSTPSAVVPSRYCLWSKPRFSPVEDDEDDDLLDDEEDGDELDDVGDLDEDNDLLEDDEDDEDDDEDDLEDELDL